MKTTDRLHYRQIITMCDMKEAAGLDVGVCSSTVVSDWGTVTWSVMAVWQNLQQL